MSTHNNIINTNMTLAEAFALLKTVETSIVEALTSYEKPSTQWGYDMQNDKERKETFQKVKTHPHKTGR